MERTVVQEPKWGPETSRLLARAEATVLRLSARERADLVSVSRCLLRSEAIVSSCVEGIPPHPRHVHALLDDLTLSGSSSSPANSSTNTPADAEIRTDGLLAWLRIFASAVLEAAERAGELADELAQMRLGWEAQLDDWRAGSGTTRALRSDSAVHAILRDLPATPVLAAAAVRRIHGASEAAALKALETLREAEILSTLSIGRGKRAYLSGDVLNLITVTERQLASTRFDTRLSPPVRPVPAAPAESRRA